MAEAVLNRYPNILAKAYHDAYKDELPPWEEFADALLQSDDDALIEDMGNHLYQDRFSHMDRAEFDEKSGIDLYREHQKGPGLIKGFVDSFNYSLLKANPMMYGETVEAAGVLTGSESLERVGKGVREWAEGKDIGKAPDKELQDIDSVRSFFQWLSQAAGSGIGSTAAPLAAGAGGAAAGSMVAGPSGAFLGGILGATTMSAPLNMGEIYAQLKQEGIPKEDAATAALIATLPVTALDVIGVNRLLRTVPGSQALKRRLGEGLGNVVTGIGAGAATEGTTEAGQAAIREVVAGSMTRDPKVQERVLSVLNEAAVGAVTGGALGTAFRGAADPTGEPGPVGAETSAATPPSPAAPPAPAQPGAPEPNRLPEIVVTGDPDAAPEVPDATDIPDATATPAPPVEPVPEATPQRPFLPPLDGERSVSSLRLEEEANDGKRRRLNAADLQVGDRVIVDNPKPNGIPEQGVVSDVTDHGVRIKNDEGSPIWAFKPGDQEAPPLYEIVPDQKEVEARAQEEKKQAEEKAKQDQEVAEWDHEVERAISRIQANPDDTVAIDNLKKLKNDKHFVQRPDSEKNRIEDSLLAIRQRDEAKKTAEKVDPGEAAPKPDPELEPQPEVTDEEVPTGDTAGVPATPEPGPDVPPATEAEPVGAPAPGTVRGAPVSPDIQRPAIDYKPAKRDTAITQKGNEVDVEYAVVELGDLVTSHDFYGRENPSYPQEMQPRERSRPVYQKQVADIVAKMNPRLLAESLDTERGAPIIDETGVVESGNGRTIAIRQVYETGSPKAEAYRSWLEDNGYETAGISQPVLVRIRRQPMTHEERIAFTSEANAPAVAAMSRTEMAFADAAAMPPGLAGMHKGGDLSLQRNREFVNQFIMKIVPPAEANKMQAEGGELSIEGRKRMESALLARAFGNQRLVNRLSESVEAGRATIKNAMLEVAPKWAALRDEIEAGNIDPRADMTEALTDAVETLARNETLRTPIAELVEPPPMFAEETTPELTGKRGEMLRGMLSLFYRQLGKEWGRLRAAKDIADSLEELIDEARSYDTRTSDMFGEAREPDPEGSLRQARGRVRAAEQERADAKASEEKRPGRDGDDQGAAPTRAAGEEPRQPVMADAERGGPDEGGERTAGGQRTPYEIAEGMGFLQFGDTEELTAETLLQRMEARLEDGGSTTTRFTKAQQKKMREQLESVIADLRQRVERFQRGDSPYRQAAGVLALYPDLVAEMETLVARMAPGVGFEAVAQARDEQGRFVAGKFSGDAQRGIITVALSGDPVETLRHEVIHALRSAGLFTPQEWSSLRRAAMRSGGWLEKYDIKSRYPEYFEADTPSDPAIEEAVADAFGEWGLDRSDFSATGTRLFERIREFFARLRRALRVAGFDVSPNSVFENVDAGVIGSRGWQRAQKLDSLRYSRPDDAPPPLESAESEARLQEAEKGIQADTFTARLKDAVARIKNNITRHYPHLERTPENAEVVQKMLHLEAQANSTQDRIGNIFERVVGGLTDNQLRTLSRYLVMRDLLWTAEQGMDLPFGLKGFEDVAYELDKLQAVVDANPTIKERYGIRQAELKKLRDEMVASGVLTESQARNPHYFRHQVLEYAKVRQMAGRGKKVSSAYWHSRRGSEKDINANYAQAEAEWMFKALNDVATMRFLNWLKGSKYDKKPEMVRRAKADNRKALEGVLVGHKLARYRQLSQAIAQSMDGLREAIADAPQSVQENIPSQLNRQAQRIVSGEGGRVDEGAGIFGVVAWFANESSDTRLQNAARRVLSSVSKRKIWIRTEAIPDKYIEPMSTQALLRAYGGESDVVWQPDAFDGKTKAIHIFTGKGLPDHIAERMHETMDKAWGEVTDIRKMLDNTYEKVVRGDDPAISPNEFKMFVSAIKDQRILGGPKHEMVVDTGLAETLNDFHDREVSSGMDAIYRMIIGRWKQWVLFMPRRVLKYNLNNITGDLDALLGNPSATKALMYLPQAFKEIHAFGRGGEPGKVLAEAMDKGVVQSGLTRQDVMSVAEAMMTPEGEVSIRSFRDSLLPARYIRKGFNWLIKTTSLRENAFRYAAYIHYRKKIVDEGKSVDEIGYGATPQWVLRGLTDPLDIAAVMARDALGDYGNISVSGQWSAKRLFPFHRWLESNSTRYFNLYRNAYLYTRDVGLGRGAGQAAQVTASAALRVGFVGLRAFVMIHAFFGMVNGYNLLFHPDLEDDMGEEERNRLHLHLGKWGDEVYTIRFQGALSDFLGWIGMEEAWAALREVQKGRASLSDVIGSMAKAPVNKVVGGLTPVIKTPAELLSGQVWWPDFLNPRAIRDPWKHALRALSVEHEYDAIAKALGAAAPTRGYLWSLMNTLVYSKDAGEQAYDSTRNRAYNWLARRKGVDVPARIDARSTALYLHRKAIRYGDERAQVATRRLMRENKVFGDALVHSKRRAAPLGMLSKADRAAFLKTLSDKEKDQLKRGTAWYRETYWSK